MKLSAQSIEKDRFLYSPIAKDSIEVSKYNM